jgi:hypothetical protein
MSADPARANTDTTPSSPSVDAAVRSALESVVDKRLRDWAYIQACHRGEQHWLNVAKITKVHYFKFFPNERLQKKARRLFCFGLSVGSLLEVGDLTAYLSSVLQLLTEFAFWVKHNDSSVYSMWQSRDTGYMAFLASSQLKASSSSSSSSSVNVTTIGKPSINKLEGSYRFVRLLTPGVVANGSLDVIEVVDSLCGMMHDLYTRFLECKSAPAVQLVHKIDTLIRQLVMTELCEDMSTLAKAVVKQTVDANLHHTHTHTHTHT